MFPMQLEICTPSCASRKVASEGDNLDGCIKISSAGIVYSVSLSQTISNRSTI